MWNNPFFNDHVISSAYWMSHVKFLYNAKEVMAIRDWSCGGDRCERSTLVCVHCPHVLCFVHVICDMRWNCDANGDHFIMVLCSFASSQCVCGHHMQTAAHIALRRFFFSFRSIYTSTNCFWLWESARAGCVIFTNMHCCRVIELPIECGNFGINSCVFGYRNHSVLTVQWVHFGKLL